MEINATVDEKAQRGWELLLAKHNEQRSGQDLTAQTMETFLSLFLQQTGEQEYVRDGKANISALLQKLTRADESTFSSVREMLEKK